MEASHARRWPTVHYISSGGHRWTLGTAAAERVIAFEDGKLLLKSLKNKATGRELIADGAPSDEFFVGLGDAKQPIPARAGRGSSIRAKQTKLKQGELQLELTLQRDALARHEDLRGLSRFEHRPPMGHVHQCRRAAAEDRRAGISQRDRAAGRRRGDSISIG